MLLDEIGTTAKGSLTLKELGLNKVFDYSKPVELVRFFAHLCTSGYDIILDFFSGSATTAHAVMQLNAEDGGSHRFILVQLPEVTDEKSEAAKAGYANICEIGKARIRKAGSNIRDEKWPIVVLQKYGWTDVTFVKTRGAPSSETSSRNDDEQSVEDIATELGLTEPDTGFRVFKLDSSNLKLGQDLCEVVQPLDINGKTVYGVGADVTFIVCHAPDVQLEDAAAMAEYAPGRIIFADSCFSNTEQKSNVRLTIKDKGITVKTL
jgi:adenine-specific DNA-methyltransferase